EQAALDEAESIADAALAYFAPRWADGEPREFASVFFRNLLQLAVAARRDDYVDAAAAYGNALWASTRNGLFAAGGATTLLDQAGIVQLYAALARAGRWSRRAAAPELLSPLRERWRDSSATGLQCGRRTGSEPRRRESRGGESGRSSRSGTRSPSTPPRRGRSSRARSVGST